MSDGEPRLRAANEADLEQLHAILAADPHGGWSPAQWRHELQLGWSRCAVLEDPASGEVLALMVFWLVAGEIELHQIATRPSARRRGLGRRLMAHLLAEGRRLGATRVALEVRAGNQAAIALYRQFGFLPAGVRRGYYQREGEDALLFARGLEGDDGAGS